LGVDVAAALVVELATLVAELVAVVIAAALVVVVVVVVVEALVVVGALVVVDPRTGFVACGPDGFIAGRLTKSICHVNPPSGVVMEPIEPYGPFGYPPLPTTPVPAKLGSAEASLITVLI